MIDPAMLAADTPDVARRALGEDGERDVTTMVTVSPGLHASAVIEVREALVLAGCHYADAVVAACRLPPIAWHAADGDRLDAGAVAGTINGPLDFILRAERPLLNLLQRACGIATLTRCYADAVAHTGCRVLHTRKTAPGLRLLDVSGVLAGGGRLHRLDLAHAVMVKDNHWAALGAGGKTLAAALAEARAAGVVDLQVEVERVEQVDEACEAGATRLLVDNQSPDVVREWADRARARRPGIEIEATGGITVEAVVRYAEAGADFVSVGALTHSVRGADLALEVRTMVRGER